MNDTLLPRIASLPPVIGKCPTPGCLGSKRSGRSVCFVCSVRSGLDLKNASDESIIQDAAYAREQWQQMHRDKLAFEAGRKSIPFG